MRLGIYGFSPFRGESIIGGDNFPLAVNKYSDWVHPGGIFFENKIFGDNLGVFAGHWGTATEEIAIVASALLDIFGLYLLCNFV